MSKNRQGLESSDTSATSPSSQLDQPPLGTRDPGQLQLMLAPSKCDIYTQSYCY